MGLSYTGTTVTTVDGHTSHQAKDDNNNSVAVIITGEVTTDYGDHAAKSVADEIYAATLVSPVWVTTTAMKAAGY